ncbi:MULTISPECIES: hypothetical protein [Stenotrophomonas]|uniref:hypothetical protein n=2 Tax=Lysobacteraceae TaxID=32033 RepID=UPI0012B4E8E5|nr:MULTISPECIES: hypothetical protein [Stenotrophomonas]MBA0263641.1 hypothetical protein [Stenotrophomonas maltophilia]MBA0468714.1 hypothetical protein [Stenotrophomonas maltophilia]MBA0475678.1 hypothetical protein [Stenotrophomonas maltophilia]MBA0483823.1 hypothetical protein [Stenotrophomonas maltophilia]MBO0392972.1 hypothetical protein [Stenotrophomonas maltophilia]
MNVRFLESRGFNQSTQVDLFIRLWDTPIDEVVSERLAILAPLQQISSPFGNMNNTGTPYPSTSCLASRFHPDFESVIEPGVKGLLFAIAIDHNLVTYTSCEGHDYRSDGREPDERHVGVVSRDGDEHCKVVAAFTEVASRFNAGYPSAAIEAALMVHTVRSAAREYPAVDLYLSKRERAGWDAYFAEVDAACAQLVAELGRIPEIS